MVMTTEQKMLRVALILMFAGLVALSVALYVQSIVLAAVIFVVITVAANTLVRCPRCGANAYREETGIGTMYSVLNTKCYKCGLSFTKEYLPGRQDEPVNS